MASRTRSAAARLGFGVCVLAALAPLSAQATALDTFYERALVSAADTRCHLFEPAVAAALAASAVQARSAALRGGSDESQLALVAQRARTNASALSCASTDLASVAANVKQGFAGYAKAQRMDYPGDISSWTAVRRDSTTGRVWNLSQSTTFGADSLTFGITQYNGVRELMGVAQFADGAVPASARLVLRDQALSPQPFLDLRRAVGGKIPLAGRVTPAAATRGYFAETRFAPGPLIAPANKKPAIAFRFPAAAVQALAELDPREAVQIEFTMPTGETRTALVEVGDFAAGRMFLSIAQR